MKRVGLIGLCKIELPDSDVMLCDGGFIVFGGETYKSKDAVFGTIGSIEPMQEGVGNEVPALEMTLLPPGTTTPGEMSQPGFQTSRVPPERDSAVPRVRKRYYVDPTVAPGPDGLARRDWPRRYRHSRQLAFVSARHAAAQLALPGLLEGPALGDLSEWTTLPPGVEGPEI